MGVKAGPRYPEVVVRLSGCDGNAFVILGAVGRALRRAGYADQLEEFYAEATAGDYDHLLRTATGWVTVE